MRHLAGIIILFLCIAIPFAGAQTSSIEPGSLESIPKELLGDALTMSIAAIVPQSGEAAWEGKEVKFTLPGTAVNVKMVGSDLAIVLTLTAHKAKDNKLILVLQSQVLLKDSESSMNWRTSVNTMTVAYGDKVLFYPLGISPGNEFALKIEVIIDSYSPDETDKKPETELSGQEKAGS